MGENIQVGQFQKDLTCVTEILKGEKGMEQKMYLK